MTPVTLDQIGLRWRDHKAALWWLALLYRRPAQFQNALETSERRKQGTVALLFLLHASPYIVLLSMMSRFLILGAPKNMSWTPASLIGISTGVAVGFAVGLIIWIIVRFLPKVVNYARKSDSVVVGLPCAVTLAIAGGALGSGSRGIVVWIIYALAVGFSSGIGIANDVSLTRVLAFQATYQIFVGILFGIFATIFAGRDFGVKFGIVSGIVITISFLAASSRVYYHVMHVFFVWPTLRGGVYPYHPAAWDDLCMVPFPGLDRLLVAYSMVNYSAAQAEIERLIDSYPAQRGGALRAKVRLVALEAALSPNLARLAEIAARLPEGRKGFLKQTNQLREWVHEIAVQQTRLDMLERPFFREPIAQALYAEIENFQHRIAGFDEPLATEFRKAAQNWQKIARHQLEEARAVVSKQPTPQVFRAGDPVDRDKEAFVPRHGIVGQVEHQIMLATGCPGIVLYGRRRTGKSTVLRNLSGFLPPSVLPVVISMQDPKAFTSQRSFMQLITSESGKKASLAGMTDEISGLYDFLATCNSRLGAEGKRLLLAVDEYELIDSKIAEGVFTENLLRMVRESIQSHRNITWVFSGSHEITELTGAPWTSYLVSARTIPVPLFKPAETRLLLTEPLKYSSLWQKDERRRPRFEPGFWGNGGIDRIHEEAGGWPHLVQLIAEAVVDLMNDEAARIVSPDLLDRALENCVVRGHNVLYELMRRECTFPGEWDYLSAFRNNLKQSPPQEEAIYQSLRRRELITEENGRWRLRVPLMARWLRERG